MNIIFGFREGKRTKKNQLIFLSVVFLWTLPLVGCAGMQEQWLNENCSKDTGYAKGMNDARSGDEMRIQNYARCPEGRREVVMAAYRAGYQEGLSTSQASVATVRSLQPLIQIGGPAVAPTEVARNERAWFCEVSPFSDHFEAFAATQLEGKKVVSANCRTQHSEIFCSDVKCRPNR